MELFEFKNFFDKKEKKISKPTQLTQPPQYEDFILYYDFFDALQWGKQLEPPDATISKQNQLITTWRRVANHLEVENAIEEIINEAIANDTMDTIIDINIDEVDLPKNTKNAILEKWEKIYNLLDFEEKGEDLFRQWFVDGQLNIECVYDESNLKKGIQKLIVMTPFNLYSFKDPKSGRIYHFYLKPGVNVRGTVEDLKKAVKIYEEEQVVKIVSGIWNETKTVPLSYLHKIVKVVNQLNLIEDSLVVYRITRSPEKRVFYIDVGRLPKAKAEEYIQHLIRKYRQKMMYNYETGELIGRPRAISILEDFWFPVSANNKGTRVETLPSSAPNLGDLEDLKYFLRKIYRGLNVPWNRIESDARVTINQGLDIEKEEVKFYKFILKLRKRFSQLFIQLLKRELIACKILSEDEFESIKHAIKFRFNTTNPLSMIKYLQELDLKMTTANTAMSFVEEGLLSKEWIRKNIFKFSDEEWEEIKQDLENEKGSKSEEEEEF